MRRTYLPKVTVVAIDCVAHELTKLAIKSTLKQIRPYETLVWSDRPLGSHWRGITTFTIKKLTSLYEVGEVLWQQVYREVYTSHILVIQYDGFVINGAAWQPEFLAYDYIGAPWPEDGQVGNGGFSLRSHRLLEFLGQHPQEFPLTSPEDAAICRTYRDHLIEIGFKFAPSELAQSFAFERTTVTQPTFGFHGLFNYPRVLNSRQLELRKQRANAYVRGKLEWWEGGAW